VSYYVREYCVLHRYGGTTHLVERSQSDPRLWRVIEDLHVAVHSAVRSVAYKYSLAISVAKRVESTSDLAVLPYG
jgi:hypothetical protein